MSKLEKLKAIKTLSEFALLLGYKPKNFSYILYIIPNEKKYIEFTIPKKNGKERKIKAPNEKLKLLQKHLAKLLTICYEEILDKCHHKKILSHGFQKNYSIITNANKHKNKRYVFNVDLKDFFPSINFGRVRGFFIKNIHFKLNAKVATIIAQIACHNNELPQGSPCSPIISNFIGHLLDIRMVQLAKKCKCTYSRYVDDLTFSTNAKNFPQKIARMTTKNNWIIGNKLKNEILKVKFNINEKKTTMQYKTSRQVTTGLIVNKKINIKQEYYKKARAMCHSLFTKGYFYRDFEETLFDAFLDDFSEIKKDFEIYGTLNQLEGILGFIYHIKKRHDMRSPAERSKEPTAIAKLYTQFFLYRYLYSFDKPLIICEGKTDNIYLKCALKNLKAFYPDLIQETELGINFKINFLKLSKNMKTFLTLPDGVEGLKKLMNLYIKERPKYKIEGKFHPVIVLLDTDDGSKTIMNFRELHIRNYNDPFTKFIENLYILFISNESNKEIENLFDEKLTKIKIDGKSFNPKKEHDSKTEYGKYLFAKRVIQPKQNEIDFNKFKYIFDNIALVIKHYASQNKL